MVTRAALAVPREASVSASPEPHEPTGRIGTGIPVVIAGRNETSRAACLNTLQPEKRIPVAGVARSRAEKIGEEDMT